MKPASLETRITAALTKKIKAADIAALVQETESAIAEADASAESERAKALDPVASPDAAAARHAVEAAGFARDRLRNVLPRLQERLRKVEDAEYLAQWRAHYEVLKKERDALAAELQEVYRPWVAKAVDLFSRITANDAELAQLHQARPSGVSLHLDNAELTARGLEQFTRDEPSIITELKLPDWADSARMAWPLPRIFDQSMFEPVPYDPRYSPNWGLVQEEERRQSREREERETKEREAKKLENYHGPRWWEKERA
jgi:hypothetical protein